PFHDYGTTVTLTAIPFPGQHLVAWSGSASGSVNPLNLFVDGPKSVTATFAADAYALAVTANGPGSVARSPDQASYSWGTDVTVTATPSAGVTFLGWSGDANGSTNPLTVTMNASKNLVATFADVTPPAIVAVDPNGRETMAIGMKFTVLWNATDGRGVTGIDVLLCRTGP